jgi:hypothetical protein
MSLKNITNIFIIPILSVIGFITNLLSTIVFSLIIKNDQRDDMYKHLLLKSILEMMGCLFSTFSAMCYYPGTLKYSYPIAIWIIWFEGYIIPALFMASTGFEIAATFNCAISIEKKMKWCEKRLSFWIWVVSILVLSFGIEMFWLFTFSIFEFNYTDQFNRTYHGYFVWLNADLLSKSTIVTLGLVQSIIKHVIFLLILLTLNCYILFKLIQIGRRKRRLTTNSSSNQNINRAENRKIIMMIVLFLIFLLCHFPDFLYYVILELHINISSKFLDVLSYYGSVLLYSSYCISFFVYFAFNNIFKRLFLKIIH